MIYAATTSALLMLTFLVLQLTFDPDTTRL